MYYVKDGIVEMVSIYVLKFNQLQIYYFSIINVI